MLLPEKLAMQDLSEFSKLIEERIAEAKKQPAWEPSTHDRYMSGMGARHEQFRQLAARLIETVIRPRVQVLAGHFRNAQVTSPEQAMHCACWFGYAERFPANVKLELVVDHDDRIETFIVRYEMSVIPAFIKYEPHDMLRVAIDAVDEGTVAQWVESKVLDFLSDYLRLDRGQTDFDDETVVDPVCGMRIARSAAVEHSQYAGHPYHFCSVECRKRFEANPKEFISVGGQ